MAEGGSRRRDRPRIRKAVACQRRRGRLVKPEGWPKYMLAKRLKSGQVAYYWNARNADIKGGFSLHREALGTDYATAKSRADQLNLHLDDWRNGRGDRQLPDAAANYGTVDWWIQTYLRSLAFAKLKERTKPTYRYQLGLLTGVLTRTGDRVGQLPAKAITPAAVDKLYEALRGGKHGTKLRRANHTIDIAKKAWVVVQRTHPHLFPVSNPFVGLTRFKTKGTIQHATRAEAFALSDAIWAYGHPHLALVPLVCFEWLQRPENILAGYLRWTDYRPRERPVNVRIVHHKTGVEIWHPLEEAGTRFYPELEERLSQLERLGIPIVVTPGAKGTNRPYSFSYAKRVVREARRAAGLPEHVTMTACRHGGMTELGDAELSEQGVMSLSGHRTPDAARGYVKKTDAQRLAAARKRRAWVTEMEHVKYESQNGAWSNESE